jgi:hypothetical protein
MHDALPLSRVPTWKEIEGNAGELELLAWGLGGPGNFLESCWMSVRPHCLTRPVGNVWDPTGSANTVAGRTIWSPGSASCPPHLSTLPGHKISAKLQGTWRRGDTGLQPPAASPWAVNSGQPSAALSGFTSARSSAPLLRRGQDQLFLTQCLTVDEARPFAGRCHFGHPGVVAIAAKSPPIANPKRPSRRQCHTGRTLILSVAGWQDGADVLQ